MTERVSGMMKGTWLALDTSTPAMTIALVREGAVIAESDSLSERNHSIRLLPAIQELLASVGMKAKELDGIATGCGPGSYTGIRIGVTVAKMLAWSLKLPLISISSLEALAYGAVLRGTDELGGASGKLWVVPLMDARRGKVYTGLYEWSAEQGWRSVLADGVRLLENWLIEIEENARKCVGQGETVRLVHFAGDYDGFVPMLDAFREKVGGSEVAWDGEPLKASSVGALAVLYGEERLVSDVHGFEPNYTQLSEPEKKLVAKPVQ